MIAGADAASAAALFARDGFAAPLGYLSQLGALSQDTELWIQKDDEGGEASLVLLRGFGVAYLAGVPSDAEEAAAFLGCLGTASVTGAPEAVLPLVPGWPGCEVTQADLFVLRDEPRREPIPEGFSLVRVEDIRLHEPVHALLRRAGFRLPEFDEYYVGQRRRERCGLSETWALLRDGVPVATACVMVRASAAALVGAVATDAACRGLGLAGALVSHVAGELRAEGRVVQIVCHNETAKRVYRRLGFAVEGTRVTCSRGTEGEK